MIFNFSREDVEIIDTALEVEEISDNISWWINFLEQVEREIKNAISKS